MSYTLEYAKSENSHCSGPKSNCPSEKYLIAKGELRLGVDIPTFGGPKWKHWTCVTPKVIENMQSDFSDPSNISGWESLRPDDKERVQRAWEQGEIPENELPEPAPNHINKSANKRTVELPATNEIAAEHQKKLKLDEAESSASDKAKSYPTRKSPRSIKSEEPNKNTIKDASKVNSNKTSNIDSNKKYEAIETKTTPKTVIKTGSRKSPRATKLEGTITNIKSETTKGSTNKKKNGTSSDAHKKKPVNYKKTINKKLSNSNASNKKLKTVSDEPKVAPFATRNKTIKTTENKPREEGTRRSKRIPTMKQEEIKYDTIKESSAAKKRTSTKNDTQSNKKAKKN